MMKEIRVLSIGILIGLLAAGVIILTVVPPRGEPILLTPRPTNSPIIVSVQGEVVQPGVYTLPKDARLSDAIERAGGFTPNSNNLVVNLATPLKDGDSIVIPSRNSSENEIYVLDNSRSIQNLPPLQTPTICININTATAEELQTLPGIGPTRAAAILDFREKNGPFYKLEDFMLVPGIGPSTFESLQHQIETDSYSGCE